MHKWKKIRLDEYVDINPKEKLPKRSIAKKISMDLVHTFSKKISRFIVKEYTGGVKFRNGDTLMARITPSLENGKTAFVDFLDTDELGFGSTEFLVLRAIPHKSDSNYIYYLSTSPELREIAIKSMTGTSGRQRVQTNVVKEYTFLVPPLAEQQAIAQVLSSLDDKIALLHRQNHTLEAMAEALFKQWFVQQANEQWQKKPLSDYFKLLGGYAFKSKNYLVNGIYKIITIKNVQDGYLNISSSNCIDLLPDKIKKHQLLNIGDILISLTGNVGRVCLVDQKNCLLNQRVAKIVPLKPQWLSFSYFFFRQTDMIQKLTYLSKGSAQLNLSPVETLKQRYLFPPNSKVSEFSKTMNPVLEKIIKNKLQIHNLEKLRDTLLPKLMSGEVRVHPHKPHTL